MWDEERLANCFYAINGTQLSKSSSLSLGVTRMIIVDILIHSFSLPTGDGIKGVVKQRDKSIEIAGKFVLDENNAGQKICIKFHSQKWNLNIKHLNFIDVDLWQNLRVKQFEYSVKHFSYTERAFCWFGNALYLNLNHHTRRIFMLQTLLRFTESWGPRLCDTEIKIRILLFYRRISEAKLWLCVQHLKHQKITTKI